MRARLVCMELYDSLFLMNYFRNSDEYSSYYTAYAMVKDGLYSLVKDQEDRASDQEMAKKDYQNNSGRVIFYEELYDWD